MVQNGGIPHVFTRADMVDIGRVAPVVKEVGGMETLEMIMSFIERAVDGLAKAEKTINSMRGSIKAEKAEDGNVESDVMYMANPNGASQPVPPEPVMDPPAAPVVIRPPVISALKVYQLGLGALNKLDSELTVGTVLEMARANKELILPVIEKELQELVANA